METRAKIYDKMWVNWNINSLCFTKRSNHCSEVANYRWPPQRVSKDMYLKWQQTKSTQNQIYINVCHSLLFIPNKSHDMLSTYICQQLPPTCFDVCYTIFRDIFTLLDQTLHAFCNNAVKCRVYNFYELKMLLQCLKQYVFRPSVFKKFINVF